MLTDQSPPYFGRGAFFASTSKKRFILWGPTIFQQMSASCGDNHKYIFLWVLVAILLLGPVQGATINVSPGDLLQAAVDAATHGDIIEVQSGSYCKNIVVKKAITLRGLDTGGGMPVIDAGGVGSAITLSADGVTVEGFEVKNSGDGPGDAGIRSTSMNNTIRDNEIRLNGGSGIRLERSSGNNISNNVIYLNKKHGISLDEASRNEIRENEVGENELCGIGLWNSSDINVVSKNDLHSNQIGLLLWNASSENVISENEAQNNYNGLQIYR